MNQIEFLRNQTFQPHAGSIRAPRSIIIIRCRLPSTVGNKSVVVARRDSVHIREQRRSNRSRETQPTFLNHQEITHF